MGTFLIGGKGCSTTAVPNVFIDEYLSDANDAQIKVYLFLVRMMGACLPTGVSDIADRFNFTEKDVMRALKYWEKKGVLTLQIAPDKSLCGICMLPLRSGTEGTVTDDYTAEYTESYSRQPSVKTSGALSRPSVPVATPLLSGSSLHISAPMMSASVLSVNPVYGTTAATAGTAQPVSTQFEKKSYSNSELLAFRSEASNEQLLFVAESYIGKPLSKKDLETIVYFSDVLGFSDDLIDYLIQYCVDRGKKDFRYIETVALNWAENNIVTVEEATAFSAQYDKSVYTIMKDLGKTAAPTRKERDFVKRWCTEFAFPADVIAEACSRTVLATDSHRFEYADRILTSWKEQGVRTLADIEKADQSYQKQRTSRSKSGSESGVTAGANPAAVSPSNRFHQYSQRDYDYSALEQQLLHKK